MADTKEKIKLQKWNETTEKWEVFDSDGLGGGTKKKYIFVFDDKTTKNVMLEEKA